MIEEGKKAPDFSLQDARGKLHGIGDFSGKTLVLYFYPKDDTPGCTTEANEFQALAAEFESAGAAVVGVSPDSCTSHAKFAEKYGLAFTLLSDSDKAAIEAYGAWGEKTMYGKKSMGLIRSTVIVDKDGVVQKIYRNVRAKGHAARVLDDLKALND